MPKNNTRFLRNMRIEIYRPLGSSSARYYGWEATKEYLM